MQPCPSSLLIQGRWLSSHGSKGTQSHWHVPPTSFVGHCVLAQHWSELTRLDIVGSVFSFTKPGNLPGIRKVSSSVCTHESSSMRVAPHCSFLPSDLLCDAQDLDFVRKPVDKNGEFTVEFGDSDHQQPSG